MHTGGEQLEAFAGRQGTDTDPADDTCMEPTHLQVSGLTLGLGLRRQRVCTIRVRRGCCFVGQRCLCATGTEFMHVLRNRCYVGCSCCGVDWPRTHRQKPSLAPALHLHLESM